MNSPITLAQLDEHIAALRENLRDLTEQAAARSGAADENRADDLIAAQEAELARVLAARDRLGAIKR